MPQPGVTPLSCCMSLPRTLPGCLRDADLQWEAVARGFVDYSVDAIWRDSKLNDLIQLTRYERMNKCIYTPFTSCMIYLSSGNNEVILCSLILQHAIYLPRSPNSVCWLVKNKVSGGSRWTVSLMQAIQNTCSQGCRVFPQIMHLWSFGGLDVLEIPIFFPQCAYFSRTTSHFGAQTKGGGNPEQLIFYGPISCKHASTPLRVAAWECGRKAWVRRQAFDKTPANGKIWKRKRAWPGLDRQLKMFEEDQTW